MLKVIRRVLFCMLEAVEGELCLTEILRVGSICGRVRWRAGGAGGAGEEPHTHPFETNRSPRHSYFYA